MRELWLASTHAHTSSYRHIETTTNTSSSSVHTTLAVFTAYCERSFTDTVNRRRFLADNTVKIVVRRKTTVSKTRVFLADETNCYENTARMHHAVSKKKARATHYIRSSAIAERPRDASCQFKSCQLSRNSAETTGTTSPEPSISCR